MSYRVEVAGKIFEGTDVRALLRRAVEAKRAADQREARSRFMAPQYSREVSFPADLSGDVE